MKLMNPQRIAITALFLLLAGMSQTVAAQGIPWNNDLAAAKAEAARTGKLVLVHFWAPWCKPCMRLEHNVFNRADVGQAISARYVPVKLNADKNAALAKAFGIRGIPHDVIVRPDGAVLQKTVSPSSANAYLRKIGGIADSYFASVQQQQATIAQRQPANNPAYATLVADQPTQRQPATINQRVYTGEPGIAMSEQPVQPRSNGRVRSPLGNPGQNLGVNHQPTLPPTANGLANNGQGAYAVANANNTRSQVEQPVEKPAELPVQPQAAQTAVASQKPPLGLDGFCPVTLKESPLPANDPRRWVRGDPRWGVNHRGKVYLFAGPKERDKFLQPNAADEYAPALGGADPVLAFTEGRMTTGKRDFGVWYGGMMYLFSSEASLQAFSQNPTYYAAGVRQVMGIGKTRTLR